MELVINGRQMRITPELKKHIEDRAQKIAKYGLKSPLVTLTLKVEKYRQIAEAHISVNGFILQAEEETDDMHASVDKAMTKIERQLKKYKEKGSNHRFRPEEGGGTSRETALSLTKTALPSKAEQKKPAPVVLASRKKVVEGGLMPERRVLSALTVEEAMNQIKSTQQAFLPFKDRTNRQHNLLYKKENGLFGLIELVDE